MNRNWSVLSLICLAACSGSENGGGNDKAVQACETVLAVFEAEAPPEQKGTIEKTEVKGDRVHLLVQSKNRLGETIFTDIECIFRLDRRRTEREASFKLTEIALDGGGPFSLVLLDADLKAKGGKTVAGPLSEKGLDAIPIGETRLKAME